MGESRTVSRSVAFRSITRVTLSRISREDSCFPRRVILRMIAALCRLPLITPRQFTQNLRFLSTMATSVKPFGWAISDRIKYEVVKQDVWTVFSPASGFVPKVLALSVSTLKTFRLICCRPNCICEGFYQPWPRFHELGTSYVFGCH